MRIIDTHLHLVYQDHFNYPWLDGAPAINRNWSVENYLEEARPLGIEAALHMEVDVAETDIVAESRFMTTVHPAVIGAIAGCRPESPGFAEQLEALAAIKGVRGVRRVLHQAPDELSQSQQFRDNIRRLARHDLNFDLCVRADQLPLATAIVDHAPDVQFVLDHCGNPDIANNGFDAWAAGLDEIAGRANVTAKVSGIVVNAQSDWNTETLRPYVEYLIERFGWDRIVWGSDHPVCTLNANLTRWVEATRTIVSGASIDEQAKLFHRNAERVYRLA
ncbi:amidohydrolase [Devosia pacifica]|uniref:Amidohydrolase n=1 Tax=Devosia pacifica TaxID=1335967 RepID=A0A918S0T5_9HYPH|nr:amidohydrolase [Devosia pacifica]GHA18484.1 amidohydrolase [Devosia pacifica]